MAEYIKREAAVEAICDSKDEDINSFNPITRYNAIYYAIEAVPAADVAPVVHGEWIEEEKEIEFYGCIDKQTFYKCSLCGRYEEKQEPYCNCGAKMD